MVRVRMARMDVRVAALIALVSAAFLFVGLSRYGVVNADEAIYQGVAEHMAETGDWLHLDFRGERRVYDTFMNAPLHYWVRAGLITTLGSSRFTMRALSALFGVLTVVVTYALGCRLVGRGAAVLAAAVQLTTFHFVYLHGARTGELDTIVSCLMALLCLTLLRGFEDGRSFVPHHLTLIALALTKLPLAIVPLAAELVWLALHPGRRTRLRRYVITGLWLLPVALAWHGMQAVLERDHVGNVVRTMLGQASGHRAATGHAEEGLRLGLLGNARFYAKAMLYGAFPWAVAYPFAVAAAFGRAASAAGRRTALLFAAAVVLFFSLVSKHYPWYVMPAYPFLSILVGAWLHDLLRRDAPSRSGWALGFVLAACLWIGVDVFATNPFARRALVFPMRTVPRHLLGLSPERAIAFLGGAWAVAWLALAQRAVPARRALRGAAVAGLLVYAAVRVAAPLSYLDYQSPLQRLHTRIQRERAAGKALDYPIPLGRPSVQIARYLFGEDFELVTRLARGGGTRLLLYEKGDRTVLSRSIGRAGLEWRFAHARQQAAKKAPPGPP